MKASRASTRPFTRIDLRRANAEGRLLPNGYLLIDLTDRSYYGGYYERWRGKKMLSCGSIETFLSDAVQAEEEVRKRAP